MSEKTLTRKVESDLLLNLKDIEKIKSSNADVKFEDRRLLLDKEIENYNKEFKLAIEAPIPNIALHGNQVLIRAVPLEMKTKGGLIIAVGDTNIDIANKIQRMNHAVLQHQEILLIGQHVTEEERNHGIQVGRWCKFSLKNMRSLHDRMAPGVIDVEYDIPKEWINGFPYVIIDKRDIIYTYEK